jgi:ATP-dependent Clp endopeptidase proteolytic subunit ClpP
MNKNWYNIKAEASSKSADVYIFDEIGTFGLTAQSFIEEIKSYKDTPMSLHINCVGGDVFEGMAIYNVLKKRTARTTVYIEGIAASMGSVIALAGDEVVMAENSLFMIHNAWGGAMGEATEIRKTAALLDKISGEIADIYTKKTNLPYNRVKEMMDEETWLSADEAFNLGFIDSISDAIKVAAKYDVSKFKNITDKEIQNKLSVNLKSKKMTEELKNWFNAKVEEVEVMMADEKEVSEKLTGFEAKVTELDSFVAELVGEKETLTQEVERLNALLSKADAKGTELSTDGDPVVIENKVENKESKFFSALAEKLK